MSQLQSVLRRSVAHLDPSDNDGRERMFANAREAMIRLLWSYDPPLSPSEIDSKIEEFDDIVENILGEVPDDETPAEAIAPADDAPLLPSIAPVEAGTPAFLIAAEPAPEPEPEPIAALPDRRAEALAILRRPARFAPLPQIGSPTPATSAERTEGALKAKKAVEEALARLNGRLAPVAEDEEPPEDEAPIEIEAEIEDDADGIDEPEAEPDSEPEADDADEAWLDEVDEDPSSDALPSDEADDETDDAIEDRDTDDETDIDETDGERLDRLGRRLADVRPVTARFDDETADEDDRSDAEDFPDEDLPDEQDLPDEDPAVDEIIDEEPARRSIGERLGEAVGEINGRRIAAIAAAALLVIGGVVGGAYWLGRAPTPQAAAPAPQVATTEPATPAPPAPTEPAAIAPAEPAAPAVAAPAPDVATGALALETLNLFDGRDPSVFQSSPDNPVRFEGDTLGGFARISSSTNSTGSRITVGRGVFERLAGRTVRIVVVARADAANPANALRFAYQNGRSLSPWHDAKLSADYAPLSLIWTVPKERGGPETDAVLIEPGIPGDGTSADVSSVRIEILK